MGRKAKLKKVRREAPPDDALVPQPEIEIDRDPTKFVQQLEKQGYNLQQVERSPELPSRQQKPQL